MLILQGPRVQPAGAFVPRPGIHRLNVTLQFPKHHVLPAELAISSPEARILLYKPSWRRWLGFKIVAMQS